MKFSFSEKALPLGELARERLRGQARCDRASLQRYTGSLSKTMLSPCLCFSGSILALSVSLRSPAPPKGEPLACRSGFHWTSKARCLGNGSAPLSGFTADRQNRFVQKYLPSVARPSLLRHIRPSAVRSKYPGLPMALPLGELSAKQTERAALIITKWAAHCNEWTAR